MVPYSSTLAWKIPWTEEPGRLQSLGLLRVDTIERLHFHFSLSCIGEGYGTPLQYSYLENPMDGGAVLGVTISQTEWLHFQLFIIYSIKINNNYKKTMDISSIAGLLLTWSLILYFITLIHSQHRHFCFKTYCAYLQDKLSFRG